MAAAGALLAHSGKAGARAVVNMSPGALQQYRPSITEDIATSGLLYVVYAYPYVSGAVAVGLLVFTGGMMFMAWRIVGRLFHRRPAASRARP
ncbi:MAG: DUF4126 domain-containing protein [Methylovirgula sp.]